MKSSAFGSDDDVERAVRRLSATVRSQRKQMTDSLGELEREVNALTDMSPNRAAASGELAALKFELVQAKQREATAIEASPSGGAQVQRLKLELNLANEEVQKRGAQIRSMELKLRGQDEQSKRLIALEEQLERQRRAHEQQLATHRQAEQDLAARLEEAQADARRAARAATTAASAATPPAAQRPDLSEEFEEMERTVARSASRDSLGGSEGGSSSAASAHEVRRLRDELAREKERYAALEARDGERRRRVLELEGELEELQEEKAAWLAESARLEEQVAAEIARSGELRTKYAAERSTRKQLEIEASKAAAARLPPTPTAAATAAAIVAPVAKPPPPTLQQPRAPAEATVVARPAAAQEPPVVPAPAAVVARPQAPAQAPPGARRPPPETTGSMRPTDDDDDDDDDYGDGDDDVRAPPSMGVPSGGSAAAAEDGDGDATLSLRIVGTLEPGSVLRLIEGRAADPSERRDVRDASTTEWFRMPRGGASSAADPASEAPVWRGATYQCSAEDVGYVICASVGGRMASAPKPIAPNRMALTHIQGKLEQGRHEFRATDAASGALLLVVLTRAKIEVVPSPTEAATAGEAAGGARKKAKAKEAKPLLSAAWGGGGVALRFALGTDDELTVHAGVHARKAKHHTSVAVKLGNSQQRDLLLLAACAHANPAWLQQALAGQPTEVGALTQHSGSFASAEPPGAAAFAPAAAAAAPPAALQRFSTPELGAAAAAPAARPTRQRANSAGSVPPAAGKSTSTLARVLSFGLGRKKKQ